MGRLLEGSMDNIDRLEIQFHSAVNHGNGLTDEQYCEIERGLQARA